MNKKESLFIDVVKGTAIFLMLWGHCIEGCANGSFSAFEHPVFQLIYTFHMPLFMLVSGYLFFFSFRKRELKPLLIHRTQNLLQPILLGGVLNQVLMLLMYNAIGYEMSVLNGTLMPGLFTFWFLWCVLFCSIVVGIACKVTEKWYLQMLLLIPGAGLILLLPAKDLNLCMYPFFVIGFFYAMYRDKIPGWFTKLRYLSFIVYPALLPFYELRHSFYITPVYSQQLGITASFLLNLYRTAVGLAGSLFVMTLLWELVRWGKEEGLCRKLLAPFGLMGKYSLQHYCISTTIISGYLPELYPRFVAAVGYNVFEGRMGLFSHVFTPLLAVAYALVIGLLVIILKKLKIHSLIFGR